MSLTKRMEERKLENIRDKEFLQLEFPLRKRVPAPTLPQKGSGFNDESGTVFSVQTPLVVDTNREFIIQ